MKKVIVSVSNLKKVLREELENAFEFEWSGWRIPIYIDIPDAEEDAEEIATFSAGSWTSNNSWQPGEIEITSVERWTLGEGSSVKDFIAQTEVSLSDILSEEKIEDMIGVDVEKDEIEEILSDSDVISSTDFEEDDLSNNGKKKYEEWKIEMRDNLIDEYLDDLFSEVEKNILERNENGLVLEKFDDIEIEWVD